MEHIGAMGVDHFGLEFYDIDTVFHENKCHRRVQRVLITHKCIILDVGWAVFGLGDFLSAKKILSRPPSVVGTIIVLYNCTIVPRYSVLQ